MLPTQNEEKFYAFAKDIAKLITKDNDLIELLSLHIFYNIISSKLISNLIILILKLKKNIYLLYFYLLKSFLNMYRFRFLILQVINNKNNISFQENFIFVNHHNKIIFKINSNKHKNYLDSVISTFNLRILKIEDNFKNDSQLKSSVLMNNFKIIKYFPGFSKQILYWENFLKNNAYEKIVFIEGDNLQDKIISYLCKDKNIFTFCLQWGIFSLDQKIGFKYMPYKTFLSFGKYWSVIYKQINKNTKIANIGYLNKLQFNARVNNICVYLTSSDFKNEKKPLEDLISISKVIVDWSFKIRLHPSLHPQHLKKIEQLTKGTPVSISKNLTLAEDLDISSVVITVGSSAAVEAIYCGVKVLSFSKIIDIQKEFEHLSHLIMQNMNKEDIITFFQNKHLTNLLQQHKKLYLDKREDLIYASAYESIKYLRHVLSK